MTSRNISAARSMLGVCVVAALAIGVSAAPAEAVADATGTLTVGGPAVTITTTTANENAALTFTGTASSRLALEFSDLTYATCVKATLKNPNGTVARPAAGVCGPTFVEPTTLSATGTYTLALDPIGTGVGSVSVRAFAVAADVTGTLTVGGAAVTVATTVAAQNADLTFAGTANQKVALQFTALTYAKCVNVTVKKPDASVLKKSTAICSPTYWEPITIPTTGTYTVALDPTGTAIGSVTVRANAAGADSSGTLTVGGAAVTVTTTTSGQNASVTFTGTAAQRVSINFSGSTFTGGCLKGTVKNPDGSVLKTLTGLCGATKFFDPFTLPTTGTYTLALDPTGTMTGSIAVQVYGVGPDATAAATVGGTAVTVTTTAPGQNASVTFAGTAGQRVSLTITAAAFADGCLMTTVTKPDGSELKGNTTTCAPTTFVEPMTLPTTGTYKLQLDAKNPTVGAATVQVYSVPADAVQALTLGATTGVTVAVTVPGQNARLTFNGTANQTVTIKLTNSTMGPTTATVKKADGTTVATRNVSGSGVFTKLALPATGAYTVHLDPRGAALGAMTGQLAAN